MKNDSEKQGGRSEAPSTDVKPASEQISSLDPAESAPRKCRILLVEDHPMMREHLGRLIEGNHDMEVCGEADEVWEAMRLIQERAPDLVIVDIVLRNSNGMHLLEDCRKLGLRVPILVLSMYESPFYAEQALKAGAQGYVPKSEASVDVVRAIRKVLAGEVYLNEWMTSELIERIALNRPDPTEEILDGFSDRELKILKLIGQGKNTPEIAQELGLSKSAVAHARFRIKLRLGTSDKAGLQRRATELIVRREMPEGASDL